MQPSSPAAADGFLRLSGKRGETNLAPAATPTAPNAAPRRVLGMWQPAAVVVGMVIGAGIFRSAADAARAAPSEPLLLAAWTLGGVFAMLGALCYAELATTYPSPGGDYHFLREAFGRSAAFLFAWSRFAIIFTASSAMLAFVGADYLALVLPIGGAGKPVVAVLLLLLLTAVNLRGVRVSAGGQIALVALDVVSLCALGVAGLLLVSTGVAATGPPAPRAASAFGGFGTAMVFVMLAYGGFNDAATLSAEVRRPRDMTRALVGGMGLVTGLYLVANWAYLKGLGVGGLAASDAPAADLMRRAFGVGGERLMVALAGVTSVSSLNALVIVGGRTLYAASGDQPALARLAAWDQSRGVPRAAVLTQAAIAIAMVGWGAWTRRGFAAMVDYMAPVYWLFLAVAGMAVMVLRVRQPRATRPYRAPMLWLVAPLFVAGSLYILVSSVLYVGWTGCALSFGMLALGGLAMAVGAWLWPPRPASAEAAA